MTAFGFANIELSVFYTQMDVNGGFFYFALFTLGKFCTQELRAFCARVCEEMQRIRNGARGATSVVLITPPTHANGGPKFVLDLKRVFSVYGDKDVAEKNMTRIADEFRACVTIGNLSLTVDSEKHTVAANFGGPAFLAVTAENGRVYSLMMQAVNRTAYRCMFTASPLEFTASTYDKPTGCLAENAHLAKKLAEDRETTKNFAVRIVAAAVFFFLTEWRYKVHVLEMGYVNDDPAEGAFFVTKDVDTDPVLSAKAGYKVRSVKCVVYPDRVVSYRQPSDKKTYKFYFGPNPLGEHDMVLAMIKHMVKNS